MTTVGKSSGPLAGMRVVEVAGVGPAPFCGMLLSDYGADVIRVDRPAAAVDPGRVQFADQVLGRGRRSVTVDLKHPDGVATVLDLVDSADALLEGFRPGTMERLGLGPDTCLARNPRLVYGRMTGWGQEGPLAHAAGHDINYLALAGTLDPIGRRGEAPLPPLNLLGDFGGGGMLLALGVTTAMVEAGRSGRGQVIDAAIVDGSALLTTMIHEMRAHGHWNDERGTNAIDSGSHFYNVYETSDGRHLSVAPMEEKFYRRFLELLDIPVAEMGQWGRDGWDACTKRLAEVFRGRTLDEWCALLEGTDACVAPVLTLAEAPAHPHNAHRGVFTTVDGVVQPAPAPRFSRTPAAVQGPPARVGEHTDAVLADWGVSAERIAELRSSGAVG